MERNLMVAGFGGQGVMTMGKLLSQATCDSTDLNVTFFPSYGAAMRGGTANCYVVISDDEIGAPVSNSVDDLIVMNGPSLHKFLPNLKPGGTLFINSSIVKDPIERRHQGNQRTGYRDGSGNGQPSYPQHHHAGCIHRLHQCGSKGCCYCRYPPQVRE